MLIVDRIHDDIAVCEQDDRSMVEIPLGWLPEGVRPGDCLHKTPEGFQLDPEETLRRRKRNSSLFASLLADDEED